MQAFAGNVASCGTAIGETAISGSQALCAYARQDASAFTPAFLDACSSAVADAFATHCSCGNAEAWKFGDVSLVADSELFSGAEASASAVACVGGMPMALVSPF